MNILSWLTRRTPHAAEVFKQSSHVQLRDANARSRPDGPTAGWLEPASSSTSPDANARS